MRWFKQDRGEYSFPLRRSIDRVLPPDYSGPIYTWDIDNTYIRTEIRSVRAMLAIPFELGVDKKPFPGAAALLREIRRGPGADSRETPLFFVSASPVQLKKVLESRMLLDGIQHDGITLRDWGALLRGGDFRKLKDPLAYKLSALILARLDYPPRAKEILFGDDTERDAVIYSLYGDIVAGRLRGEPLGAALHDAPKKDRDYLVKLADGLSKTEAVEAIFIHQVRQDSHPDRLRLNPRVWPIQDYLQAALRLHSMEQIGHEGLMRVVDAVSDDGVELERSLLDARDRGLASTDTVRLLGEQRRISLSTAAGSDPVKAPEADAGSDPVKAPEADSDSSSSQENQFLTPASYRG